jgi:DNA-binding transcriptional regulator YiaG
MTQDTSEAAFDGKTFGEALIAAMEEAVAFERGELQLRTRTVEIPGPEAPVPAPPDYDGARVRAVRDKLALSPQTFAAALNVSPQTVRAWERDVRRPDGPTLRLLEIAEEHPEALLATIMPGGKEAEKAERAQLRAG